MKPHRHIGHKESGHISFDFYVKTYVTMCLCGSKKYLLVFCLFLITQFLNGQPISKVWVGDNGYGTYKNPIIHADYSDPDVIRVGDDYYMISSSFNCVPGLPILHSKDMVNWELIGYALNKLPSPHYDTVQHGNGVWAPSIRYHNGEFYIYYPDPDFGIYLVKSKNILGPWGEPILVEAGKGLIDPCPFWDENVADISNGWGGKLYLVHAYAGSRAGIKSILVVKELNKEGTKVISEPVLVYDGHQSASTIEGPKFYKRNGYYYIFAPAGGVPTGWQMVLRSKNIFGPYKERIVLLEGSTGINGPHQGAWVQTQTGEDWFIHFQDKGAYGRVVHLQPMYWINDWPVMGIDPNNDGRGEPVLTHAKPKIVEPDRISWRGKLFPIITPAETDEFNSTRLGLQWQWQANPKEGWAYTTALGFLKMFSVYSPDSVKSAYDFPNILTQKFPAETFKATVKLDFKPRYDKERFGVIIYGTDYAAVYIQNKAGKFFITYNECSNADKGKAEEEVAVKEVSERLRQSDNHTVYLRVSVSAGAVCHFSFSEDGENFTAFEKEFIAKPGRWVGAKIGMFCSRNNITNDAGSVDIDWFRIEPLQ